jgi:large subunit ribosomal protein L22
MSAYKVREVLDLIRGQEVGRAAEILQFCERGAAEAVGKVLASAVANAAHNDELDPEELFVSACFADEGKTQRRMRPRARGRATRIRKRSAHVTIIVSRLPEDRLARLRAKRVAEQAARRSRRGRGGAPDRARRVRRGRGEDPSAPLLDAAEAEAIAETELEEGIVDSDAFAVAAADAAEEELEAEEEIEVEHELEPADLEPVDEVAEDEEPEGSAE